MYRRSRAWSLWASPARPVNSGRKSWKRQEERLIYRDRRARTHAHTSGLSGIHPRSQISIMSAAMRRYTLLFPSPFILSFSICRFAFALLPSSALLPCPISILLLFSGAMRETRYPGRERGAESSSPSRATISCAASSHRSRIPAAISARARAVIITIMIK